MNLILPVGVRSLIVGQGEIVCGGIVTQVACAHHFHVLIDLVESDITVVVDINPAVLSSFGRNDDDTVGRF